MNNQHQSANPGKFDLFPTYIRNPQIYILPKTHKPFDASLPLGYPGRPIVSACSSNTENISKYFDYVLNPAMQHLPSYVKDITYFINKIKYIKLKKDCYFVTVSSLYSNIPHSEGIDACK